MSLFYQLIDLVRSPEIIKKITNDYGDHVKENMTKHTKEQIWVVKRKLYLERLEEMKEKINNDGQKDRR